MDDTERTPEQLRQHFEVERELADRYRAASRDERLAMASALYEELFRRVPRHSRVTRREEETQRARAVQSRLRLIEPFLDSETIFLEFAPGDCALVQAVAGRTAKAYGVDISDQRREGLENPANFELIIYDGFHFDFPAESVDLVFSYQMLEHLHPEDMDHHFATVFRILKPGGCYVFSTPHRFSGPHDISRHFSDVPLGFHLKEWTYRELAAVARQAGFPAWYTYRFGKLRPSRLWNWLTLLTESLFGLLPRKLQRRTSSRLFEGVTMLVRK
jgi:SAM-dependent methyltransferase